MAGVELTLTKGNKGTQCPHLTSQAGAPTENGSTALTKSKKKRLRKKKKVETESSSKGLTVITKTVGTDTTISPGVGVDEPVSVVEAVSQKIEAKVPKDIKRDKPIGEGGAVVPGISKANVKEVNSKNNNLKDPKIASKRNNTKDPELNIQEDLKVTSLPVLKNGEAGRVVMETVKSTRDDVLAQREAKKLAKLSKKNKSGGVQIAPVQADPKQKQPKPNLRAQLPNNVPNPQNASPVSDVTTQINLLSVDSVDGEVAHKVRHALVTQAEPVDPSLCQVSEKLEKSRDVVIAGREGKKQAKLAAKNKKDSPATQLKETAAETTNVASHKVTKMEESPAQSCQNDVNHVAQDVRPEKSKAALRAERRAKQEAQRAAKEGLVKEAENTKHAAKNMSESAASPKDTIKSAAKAQTKPRVPKIALKSILLSHFQMDSKPLSPHIYLNAHPAIVELGAKYAARVVSGSNARCIALLRALKSVIVDFVTPREKEFSRAMETRLNDSMSYLNTRRQSSVSMTNALKHVKSHLTQLTTEKTSDDDARKKLCEVIDIFIKEQIDVAGQAISSAVAKKISNGDTIAIYGCSSLLLRILVESHNEGKDFEVVVVDGGPLYEGKEMCRRLVSENIKCSYVLLPAFSYIVSQTTKVLLGAHALLANGCVMSRSGTASVAMVAKSHNVPVIVCCETYKFCERVQADAFVHNELNGPLTKSSSPPTISLMYDMTPPTLVDAVATELAFLPCTSVPVILRVKPSDISSYYY